VAKVSIDSLSTADWRVLLSCTMIIRLLVKRAFTLLKKEGPGQLLRQFLAFARYLWHRWFLRRTVYLYEHTFVARDRSNFLPRLESWELRVMTSNEDADRVAAEGFDDYREAFVFAHRSLDAGAVAFCVYVEKELAHVGWLAVDAKGKSVVDKFPFHVAFEQGQACTGGTYTMPKYRGKGLMPYGYYERFEYLRARGFTSSRNSVAVDNVSSQKAHTKFNPTIYAIGRYRKFLWWTSWRTEELPNGPAIGMPPAWRGSHT
jgi:GNAT superfamily N-acetyltransferase